jgi:hypothetical protein
MKTLFRSPPSGFFLALQILLALSFVKSSSATLVREITDIDVENPSYLLASDGTDDDKGTPGLANGITGMCP